MRTATSKHLIEACIVRWNNIVGRPSKDLSPCNHEWPMIHYFFGMIMLSCIKFRANILPILTPNPRFGIRYNISHVPSNCGQCFCIYTISSQLPKMRYPKGYHIEIFPMPITTLAPLAGRGFECMRSPSWVDSYTAKQLRNACTRLKEWDEKLHWNRYFVIYCILFPTCCVQQHRRNVYK